MIGVVGHGSAADHACCLRLSQECGNRFRCYQMGTNAALARAPWTVAAKDISPEQAARVLRDDGISVVLVTNALLLQTDLVDTLTATGIQVFAPSRHAAQLEGNKGLMKRLMTEAGVPTPEAWLVGSVEEAKALLRRKWSNAHRYVVKCNALIGDARHRAMVPETLVESLEDVDEEIDALAKEHAPLQLLIEERIRGFETSVHVVWDGTSYVVMPPVRDYKRVGDGDTGSLTLGTAAIACGRGFSPELDRQLKKRIIEPALEQIARVGYAYRGFVYFGVMLQDEGPELLEINVRPGNPEIVALLPLLKSDFSEMIRAGARGRLHEANVEWFRDRYSGTVFALGEGYPDVLTPPRVTINGLDKALEHGATVVENVAAEPDGRWVVAGGRVAAPFVVGETVADVRRGVLERLSGIEFPGKHFRSDLGFAVADNLFASPAAAPA